MANRTERDAVQIAGSLGITVVGTSIPTLMQLNRFDYLRAVKALDHLRVRGLIFEEGVERLYLPSPFVGCWRLPAQRDWPTYRIYYEGITWHNRHYRKKK